MLKKHYTQITLILIVLVLTTVSILTYRNLNNYIEEVNQIRHSNRVLQVLEEVFSAVKDAETGHRGYQLTRDTLFLTPYNLAVESIIQKIKTLDSLVSENPEQHQRADTLQSRINYQLLIISRILANTANSNLYLDTYEKNLLIAGKKNMDEIRMLVKEIRLAQAQISLGRIQKEATFREIAPFAILVYSLLAIGASVILFYKTLFRLLQNNTPGCSSNDIRRTGSRHHYFCKSQCRFIAKKAAGGTGFLHHYGSVSSGVSPSTSASTGVSSSAATASRVLSGVTNPENGPPLFSWT